MIKVAIDYWFVTEIEKKLMTDYQKLMGFISKLIITVIPSVCITFIYLVTSSQNTLDIDEFGFTENSFWIILFLVLFLINIGMQMMVIITERLLNIKSVYYIHIDNEKWRIERLTKNKLLLLTNNQGIFRLVDEWKNQNISKSVVETSLTYKLYNKRFRWIIAITITLILAGGCFVRFALVKNEIYKPLWLLGGTISVLSILILLVNVLEYKRNYR